jgi:hypothetical protein
LAEWMGPDMSGRSNFIMKASGRERYAQPELET